MKCARHVLFIGAPPPPKIHPFSLFSGVVDVLLYFFYVLILTLRDPPRPGPAHPREHGDSAAPKLLGPKQ